MPYYGNQTTPPMDKNGNYIINAGTKSEKRIPKSEWEAQQKNAPPQLDMDALTKMLSERIANRESITAQGQKNTQNNVVESTRTGAKPISGESEGQNYYGPNSIKSAAVQPPQGMQAVDNSVISANYKDGEIVYQDGKKFIAHNNNLYTPSIVFKDKNLFNKYSNLISNQEIGDANGPPPAVATDNSVISAPGGGKPPVKPTGVNPANDPNNLPYNNPESNKPILPTSYSGQISLPTDPYEMQLMDYLKKQFEDKTWENKYGELQKQYQELADRPDKYSGMIEKAGGEDVAGYIKSLYEGSADPLRREAQRMQDENAANLAARGLGMSTVVNDVNSGVQRELMANLGDLSNKANVQGRDMYLNALKSAADVYGQHGAQQGNVLNAMQTNIGNQMGAQQIGLGNINDILAKQEARRLTNMQTGINQWDKDVANYWKYQYYPIDAYAGQNSTAGQAAQVGTNQYNQALNSAATQNQTAGQVGSMLAQNMFKQPQNFTYQPISGGLAGAQQGAQAGFNTKPKPGAFNQ